MVGNAYLHSQLASLREEGRQLAGQLSDLAQRAAVHHHLYEHSGGRHVFPLIAAHGALWAKGYFEFGMRLGRGLSWSFALKPKLRIRLLKQLHDFADAFREINRCVCVDTYANYHFVARFGELAATDHLVPPDLLQALLTVHRARRESRDLTLQERRAVFLAHFLHEQQHVVGPRVDIALSEFEWNWMRRLALRPVVRFAYFGRRQCLRFHNFSDRDERIQHGETALAWAEAAGWNRVELALRTYQVLPAEFFTGSAKHFTGLRQRILAA